MEDSDLLVSGTFEIYWEEDGAAHTHQLYAGRLNLWRDILPEGLRDELTGAAPGDRYDLTKSRAEAVPRYESQNIREVANGRIRRQVGNTPVTVRFGRFYPKGLLAGVYGIFSENRTPFRCTAVDENGIRADFNHPLAGKNARMGFVFSEIRDKFEEHGGTSTHWLESAAEGPGMESRWRSQPTDFFADAPFARSDEQPDAVFYERPRFVQHLDAKAIENIGNLYAGLLAPGLRVLDLMSSWTSHLPEHLELSALSGLGMNEKELAANPRLTDYTVADLNERPLLPYPDATYDAVICTVSVEYLIAPFAVFAEVRRILKPSGLFILTFSNRWFPPKAVQIWTQLHEFERLGLVTEYFRQSGGFDRLNVYTLRGHARPEDDRYYPGLRLSDPVFAVWGRKA